MIGLPSLSELDRSVAMRIWLCALPADMRCSFDRLAELAKDVTNQNPTDGPLFHSRGGDRLKILLWGKDGFTLWYKRLEEGMFKWPGTPSNARSLEPRPSELAMLLDGIDLNSVKRSKR